MNGETVLNADVVQTRDQLCAIYLQQLQALASEISSAMDAIAANALPKLEQSVANQEMLCSSLSVIANSASIRDGASNQLSLVGIDPDVNLKIRTTTQTIRDLSLKYAALLRHSSRSIALLASLCRSHTGQLQEARGPRLKHQTWSCEM